MEQFIDPVTRRPVTQLVLAAGQTKVVAVKKFAMGTPPSVLVLCKDPRTAFCHQVSRLADPTKLKYIDWKISDFTNEMKPLERDGLFFFQICGYAPGSTELTAPFSNPTSGSAPYASSLTVEVTPSLARPLTLAPVPFDTLWRNHPYNPLSGMWQSCSAKWLGGQCMIRFCTVLKRSGGSFAGLTGHRCGVGKDHGHHFIDPYDFSKWKRGTPHFIWEANRFQPEPMPGIAAMLFMAQKKGVVVFWNYFPGKKGGKDMAGGHIDLWNEVRMGNTLPGAFMVTPDDEITPQEDLNHMNAQSAFLRARKIEFWPVN
jgi:hypothetical protein